MFVALKEIRRSLGRFALLTAAVGLLVLLLLFFQAVAGTLTSGLTGAIESASADVLVYDDRARRNPSASVLDPSLVEEIAAVDGVAQTAAISITVATGTTATGEQTDVALFGGDPTAPALPRSLSGGRLPETSTEVLFSGTAFDDTVVIGDELVIGPVTLTVVGTADDAAFNVLPTLYVSTDAFTEIQQDRAGAPIDVPTSLIGVTVADGAEATTVAEAITAQVAGVEALDRASAVADLPGAGQITQSFSILYLLLFIVVTIVTGVFFLILTVQKKDSLVLLQAVGGGRIDVLVPVLLQVVAVTGLGALAGAASAAGLLHLARDTFGSTLDPATAVATVAAILVLGLLASLGAVRRVLAIDPVDAVTTSGGI